MKKFKGLCGEMWITTAYVNGHISLECTHEDGCYMTTDRTGAKEEANETCKKCPYSIAN